MPAELGEIIFSRDESHKYCVGFRKTNGSVFPVQTYETLEELEKGYVLFLRFFGEDEEFGWPIPIEKDRHCGIVLTDMIERHERDRNERLRT